MQELESYEYNVQPATPVSAQSNMSEQTTEPLNFNEQQVSSPVKGRVGGGDSNGNAQQVVLREKLVHAFRLNRKKQLTLDRINKYNKKLMEELKTPRVKASNCALMVINYTEQTKDPLIPSIWGENSDNKFKNGGVKKNLRSNMQLESTPAVNNSAGDGCCTIM